MKRNHLTVARLRDLRLHAVRISGHLHVTGLSIHDCLVVPTRTFWSALARIAGTDEPDFGEEYAFFRRCRKLIGSRRLDFTVTVHVDKAQLLTDVRDPADGTPGFSADFAPPVPVDASAERRLPWEDVLEAILDERCPALESDDDDPSEAQNFPLLQGYDPEHDSRRVWGWELPGLPQGKSNQLLSGPDGTLRPSRN